MKRIWHKVIAGQSIGQELLLRMGKVLGTPMRPRESVFLGYSAHLCLNIGNDAIYCTPEGDYTMSCENMLYAFENMLNAFENMPRNKSWKP